MWSLLESKSYFYVWQVLLGYNSSKHQLSVSTFTLEPLGHFLKQLLGDVHVDHRSGCRGTTSRALWWQRPQGPLFAVQAGAAHLLRRESLELRWRRHHGSFTNHQPGVEDDGPCSWQENIDRQLLGEWKVLVDEWGGASARWEKKIPVRMALAGESDESETRLGPWPLWGGLGELLVRRRGGRWTTAAAAHTQESGRSV